MTVFINARFLTQPQSGVQRYAGELVSALDRRLQSDAGLRQSLGPVVALHPRDPVVDHGWQQVKLRALRGGTGHVWEQGALWRASRGGILLSLGNSGPLLHRRQVLALHDANLWEIPQAFSRRYRVLHRFLRPRLARRAAALISVSHFSARALAARTGVSLDRFTIIPNAATHILSVDGDPNTLDRYGLYKGGYLLTVGNQSPNKNIQRLVTAHTKSGSLTLPLVVVGGAVTGLSGCTARTTDRVRPLGRVSEPELKALYEGAAGFVYPSLYEGFGIPPLEAMQLGIPVLAARRTALPEVLGDAPLWFDPTHVPDMARALQAFDDLDPCGRRQMSEKGLRRCGLFDWDRSAGDLVSLLLGMGVDECDYDFLTGSTVQDPGSDVPRPVASLE
jgi:glycosyltransferase involved in cell wall biosynthesis